MRSLFFSTVLILLPIFCAAKEPAAPANADPTQTSSDPKYGHTTDNPVRVGSAEEYGGPAAERAYFRTLIDEKGEPVEFERKGSFGGGPDGNMLDGYMVKTSTGREYLIYIDMYHPKKDPNKQLAPKGLYKRKP